MRISYEYLFSADNIFLYKEKKIEHISILIEFTILKNGKEIPIKEDKVICKIKDKNYYFHNFLDCSIADNENGFKLTLQEELLKNIPYEIQYKPIGGFIGVIIDNWEEKSENKELAELTKNVVEHSVSYTIPERITFEEFLDILKTNFDTFNDPTNISCEVPSYSIR